MIESFLENGVNKFADGGAKAMGLSFVESFLGMGTSLKCSHVSGTRDFDHRALRILNRVTRADVECCWRVRDRICSRGRERCSFWNEQYGEVRLL